MALIIVLWTMVLLMFLVGHIEAAGRSEAKLALNLRRAASLEAQADGAIALAAFHLLDQPGSHWSADGEVHVVAVPRGGFTRAIRIRITDQSGKINLNSASPPLLQALISATGVPAVAAAGLARNIAAWRAPNGDTQAELRTAAQYRAAGYRYGPPAAPFESIGELGLVQGITPKLADSLRPDLTLFNPGLPDLAFAPPAVTRALAAAHIAGAISTPHPVGLRVVGITATAIGADGDEFVRHAIVRVGPQQGGWLRILTWTNPAATDAAANS